MKSPDHLSFNTQKIPETGMHLADSLPATVLDLAEGDLLQPGDPVQYDVTARVVGLDLLVDGRVETAVAAHCDRCDQPFMLPLVVDRLYYFQEAPLPIFVDITEFIREELLLQIPTKILCSDDCQPVAAADPIFPVDDGASPWQSLDKLDLNP